MSLPIAVAVSCATDRHLLNRVDLSYQYCKAFETIITGVTTLGEVRGTVSPEQESIGLPDVDLVLRRLGTAEVVARERSDSSGHFEFSGISAGLYQLETCFEGFDSIVYVVRVRPGLKSEPLALGLPLSG